MEDILYSEKDLKPKRGDFSLVMGNLYRVSLIHDFNFLEKNKLWDVLDSLENIALFNFLRLNFYYLHCDTTFERNINSLTLIKEHGWMEFIIQTLNENVYFLHDDVNNNLVNEKSSPNSFF